MDCHFVMRQSAVGSAGRGGSEPCGAAVGSSSSSAGGAAQRWRAAAALRKRTSATATGSLAERRGGFGRGEEVASDAAACDGACAERRIRWQRASRSLRAGSAPIVGAMHELAWLCSRNLPAR